MMYVASLPNADPSGGLSRKPGRGLLELYPKGVREERHHVVLADQRQELDDLGRRPPGLKLLPQFVGDSGCFMEIVDQSDQEALALGPRRVCRAAQDRSL